MQVGILALQGGFADHRAPLEALGHRVALVKRPEQLDACDGLVLPGGESTTQLKLLASSGLRPGVTSFVDSGKPVFATCAGVILLAAEVTHPAQESLGRLDIAVARNGWGRHVHSFEAVADVAPEVGLDDLHLVFIRAPRIERVGAAVEVLARVETEPVLVRQGAVVAATFHPELTNETRVHALAFGGG